MKEIEEDKNKSNKNTLIQEDISENNKPITQRVIEELEKKKEKEKEQQERETKKINDILIENKDNETIKSLLALGIKIILSGTPQEEIDKIFSLDNYTQGKEKTKEKTILDNNTEKKTNWIEQISQIFDKMKEKDASADKLEKINNSLDEVEKAKIIDNNIAKIIDNNINAKLYNKEDFKDLTIDCKEKRKKIIFNHLSIVYKIIKHISKQDEIKLLCLKNYFDFDEIIKYLFPNSNKIIEAIKQLKQKINKQKNIPSNKEEGEPYTLLLNLLCFLKHSISKMRPIMNNMEDYTKLDKETRQLLILIFEQLKDKYKEDITKVKEKYQTKHNMFERYEEVYNVALKECQYSTTFWHEGIASQIVYNCILPRLSTTLTTINNKNNNYYEANKQSILNNSSSSNDISSFSKEEREDYCCNGCNFNLF